MKINIEAIEYLIRIFKEDSINGRLMDRLMGTKGMEGFIDHENARGKRTYIRREIEKLFSQPGYQDLYGFHKIRDNLDRIEKDIENIKKQEKNIVEKAIKNLYKIIPRNMGVKYKIYLYFGGGDGGFTINRRAIYINYKLYIEDPDELIKILGHELYHCRNIPHRDRILFSFRVFLNEDGKIYEIMGKVLEEGLASLVQHGRFLEKDDPAGSLTKRKLLLIKDDFNLLNQVFLNLTYDRAYKKELRRLNIYSLGYYIVSTIYNKDGILALDSWTVNLNMGQILARYMEICQEKGIESGLDPGLIKRIKACEKNN